MISSATSSSSAGSDEAMIPTYEKLSNALISNHMQNMYPKQHWIGIAGGPGAGKSTLAAAVAQRINLYSQREYGKDIAVVIPMDGYHYSRDKLREIGSSEESPYSYEVLIARRGSPWTFDAKGLVQDLTAAKEKGEASLPVYSRQKSDPVPDGVQLRSDHCLVLVEGNYLFNFDDPDWEPLRHIFEEKWFVACRDLETQRNRLISRHLETWSEEKSRMWGEGAEGASKKADANDVLNAKFIDRSRVHADIVIESI